MASKEEEEGVDGNIEDEVVAAVAAVAVAWRSFNSSSDRSTSERIN